MCKIEVGEQGLLQKKWQPEINQVAGVF